MFRNKTNRCKATVKITVNGLILYGEHSHNHSQCDKLNLNVRGYSQIDSSRNKTIDEVKEIVEKTEDIKLLDKKNLTV